MSWMPGADPDLDLECPNDIEMVIIPRTGDIGNFEVRRALPFRDKRMVGPFIFWDEMGPGEFLTGQGVDVRPHPGQEYGPKQMIVLRPGREVSIKALEPARITILGGAAMDGPRYVWWNFVSSSRERIEQAKEEWRLKKFGSVPGDLEEFIPLPTSESRVAGRQGASRLE